MSAKRNKLTRENLPLNRKSNGNMGDSRKTRSMTKARVWQPETVSLMNEHGYTQEDFIDPDSEGEDETVELEEGKLVIF